MPIINRDYVFTFASPGVLKKILHLREYFIEYILLHFALAKKVVFDQGNKSLISLCLN